MKYQVQVEFFIEAKSSDEAFSGLQTKLKNALGFFGLDFHVSSDSIELDENDKSI